MFFHFCAEESHQHPTGVQNECGIDGNCREIYRGKRERGDKDRKERGTENLVSCHVYSETSLPTEKKHSFQPPSGNYK